MLRCLVAYSTNAGSTAEVAEALARVLGEGEAAVDLRRLDEVTGVAAYDAVVVGAPMILGWHRPALRFLKQHRAALAQKKVAYFATLMSLTQVEAGPGSPVGPGGPVEAGSPAVQADPWLAKPPRDPRRLGLKERYALPRNYLRPLLQAAPGVRPLRVGFFGGKLELFRLKWWQALFVMAIIQAQPGDLRNWDFIEEWGRELGEALAAS